MWEAAGAADSPKSVSRRRVARRHMLTEVARSSLAAPLPLPPGLPP